MFSVKDTNCPGMKYNCSTSGTSKTKFRTPGVISTCSRSLAFLARLERSRSTPAARSYRDKTAGVLPRLHIWKKAAQETQERPSAPASVVMLQSQTLEKRQPAQNIRVADRRPAILHQLLAHVLNALLKTLLNS